MLDSLWGSVTGSSFTLGSALLCSLTSLALGLCVAWLSQRQTRPSRGFTLTLALLPMMVQSVIMLVNGNLGTGVAVMGAFSLVRFRSYPGSAREIGSIFFAMALGLATGMGYLFYAVLLLLLVGGASLILEALRFGEPKDTERRLRVTIPETLDYEGAFDDLFSVYTLGAELERVKTTNMGSLFELQYRIRLKGPVIQKDFLDELRCRNGNLSIVCTTTGASAEEL